MDLCGLERKKKWWCLFLFHSAKRLSWGTIVVEQNTLYLKKIDVYFFPPPSLWSVFCNSSKEMAEKMWMKGVYVFGCLLHLILAKPINHFLGCSAKKNLSIDDRRWIRWLLLIDTDASLPARLFSVSINSSQKLWPLQGIYTSSWGCQQPQFLGKISPGNKLELYE